MFSFFRRGGPSPEPDPGGGWLNLLSEMVLWRRLPDWDRAELLGHVRTLTEKKKFEGANGMVVDDRVRVTIAAQASLLLLHRSAEYFPSVSSIVVYPGEYVAPWQEMDESGIMTEGEDCRSGEFAGNGALVLSWEDICQAGVDEYGAYNVVIHEFAHLLDDECRLSGCSDLWNGTFKREFHRLQHDAAHQRPSLFDHYGAESPAEFFAVLTETFFENPRPFRSRHPALYEVTARFYNQDPAGWPGW